MATLMISQGVPMILGGDELLRTQQGNNNAWCQDNPVSWVDWTLQQRNADFLRFTRMIIAVRRSHPVLRRRTFFSASRASGPPEILWHGVEPSRPDFGPESRALAFALDGRRTDRPGVIDRDIYVAVNASPRPLDFRIPAGPSGRPWRRAVDTALPSPEDILDEDQRPVVSVSGVYTVRAPLHDHPGLGSGECLNRLCKSPKGGRRAPMPRRCSGADRSVTPDFRDQGMHPNRCQTSGARRGDGSSSGRSHPDGAGPVAAPRQGLEP